MADVTPVYCHACGRRVTHLGSYCRACGERLQAPRLGRYLVGRHLGAGSAGRLLDGYDPVLERPVALRILAATATEDYLDTLRRAARLSDAGCVDVYSVLEPQETHVHRYVAVIERVDGPPVSSLRTPVPLRHGFLVVRDAILTLSRYHAAGFFHGKPTAANMLLSRRGVGILSEPVPRMDPMSRASWAFAAPENLEGEGPSAAADVYIAGLTLWTLFTGRHPFPASSLAQARVARRSLPGSTPGGVPSILMAALDPRPGGRPSIMEFYMQLTSWSRRRG